MSTDEAVTKDLIETLEDGKRGFATAAEKLSGSGSPEVVALFQRLSDERGTFSVELREVAKEYGDDIPASGSAAGAMHRGWLTLKDALTGSDAHAVLAAAEKGEDHAVAEYDKALSSDVSPRLRAVIERQAAEVHAAHDKVRILAEAKQ